MDKEAIAIELLRKVGSAGVTPGSIGLVLDAFDAVQPVAEPVVTTTTKASKAAPAPEPVADPAPTAEEAPAS